MRLKKLKTSLIGFRLFFTIIISVGGCLSAANRSSIPSLTLGASDGMSCSLTYDLQQDDEGYLWISNRMGVDRYDGYAFMHYHLTQASDNVLQLDDGKHHHLIKDEAGRLVCYTDRGKVLRYNKESDCFDLQYSASSILGNHSLHAASTCGDTLILGMYNGLYRVDLQSQRIVSHICKDYNIRTIVPYVGGTFLVGSDHGVGLLDVALDSCFTLGLPNLDVKTIYYDADQQRIWLGTNGSGLWTMHFDGSGAQQIANWENAIVMQVQPFGDSQLVVGTDGSGLLVTSRRMVTPLQQMAMDVPGRQYLLPGAGIQGVLVDGNNIWLSIFDCGISLIRPTQAVQCLTHPVATFESEQRVNDVAVDSHGNIWGAYHNSVGGFCRETGEARVYDFEKANFLTICAASDGTIWAGGYNSGLYHLDPHSGKHSYLPSLDSRSVNSNVYSIIEDSKHRIWVGSQFSPLSCILPDRNRSRYGIPPLQQMLQYDVTRINDIAELADEKLAIATTDGMVVLDLTSAATNVILSEKDSCWMGTNFISCIDTDRSHSVYIGTDGSGLVVYNVVTGAREHYSTAHGMPSNFLRSIEYVGDSLLWISTETDGIFSFSLKTHTVQHSVTHTRGLTTNGFVQEASAHLPDGTVMFGGKGGIEVINPGELSVNSDIVPFHIAEVGLADLPHISYKTHPKVLDRPLSELNRIVLPYGERSLRIRFSVVDLYHNSDYRLIYSIGSNNEFWQPLDNRQATIYTLPAGQHRMTVRCLRGEQVVAEKQILIDAEQSLWLRGPAIFLYVVLAMALIAIAFITIVKMIQHNASEEKIRFFNSVAHDIRTPLSLVSSPLADLERYVSPQAPASLMPLVKRNLKHLNDVVNQLSLFNSGSNKPQLSLEPVQICEFMSGVKEAYQPMAEHRNLSFEIQLPQEEVWVYADVKMLQRIVDNILGNAFKFTQKGGVTMQIRRHGQRGVIQISDTGIGMSESTRRKLFRHFFRGENAVNGRIPGLGLGMMYTYQAIKQMGGRLDCESQEGKGSSFTVQFPIAPAGESHAYDFSEQIVVVQEDDFRPVYSGYRYDVLVVEDSEELLDYMKQKLGEGYNVVCANCVADAKILLKSHHPDLIISDIMMPGMRGDDWCAELKSHIETSHIPVILLTANSDYQSQMQGLSMGADEYITKPFDVHMLLVKIRNIFDAKRKLHAYYMHLLNTADTDAPDKEQPTSTLDDQFVARLMKAIDKYISQPDLSVEQLASEMAMSHTLFYEKVNKVLGMPPASLIRSCRMQKAKSLLVEGKLSVGEVALTCGFTDAKYFSTAFKKFYGISPSKVGE